MQRSLALHPEIPWNTHPAFRRALILLHLKQFLFRGLDVSIALLTQGVARLLPPQPHNLLDRSPALRGCGTFRGQDSIQLALCEAVTRSTSTTSSSANFRLPSFLSNWRASSHHCNHSPHFSNLAWATVMLLELFHLLSSSCMSRYVIASWARSERHSTLDALILDSVRSRTSLKMDMVGPSPHSSAVRRILCNDAGGRRSRMMENLFRSKPFVLNNASYETFSFRTRLKSCQAQLCRPMTWCCWKEMSPQCPHQGHLNTFYSWQSASIDSIRLGL